MTNGEPETVVSASLQKIKWIKNPIKHFSFFHFIKSETSDSFVNHFDGHFAYLKILDFYFNTPDGFCGLSNTEVKSLKVRAQITPLF